MADDGPLPIHASVSGDRRVTYIYADGRTVTLHGTHPYRDNNPGNLRYVGKDGLQRAVRAGAIGIDNSFAIFPSPAVAADALRAVIITRGNEGFTIEQFLRKYAPPTENNYPAYLLAVTTALGAKASDTLGTLNADQRVILAETVKKAEGWYSRKRQLSPPVEGRQPPSR